MKGEIKMIHRTPSPQSSLKGGEGVGLPLLRKQIIPFPHLEGTDTFFFPLP